MKPVHKAYLSVLALMLVVDALWIGLIAAGFYKDGIGHLMAKKVNFLAAAVFYLLYVAGIFFFAVMPALRTGKKRRAAFLGGALGLIAYATYDLSNMATLEDWPLAVTAVDIVWGTLLTAVLATYGFVLLRKFSKQESVASQVPVG